MAFKPTGEQVEAVAAFRRGKPLKIAAFAGTGKTSTLKLLAEARPGARGLYLAFNKAIAAEAKSRFPKTVDCRTTHSIAFREIMPRYGSPGKMTGSLHPKQLAATAKWGDEIYAGRLRLTAVQRAHLVLGTVKRFCQGAEDTIQAEHVPEYGRLLGAPPEVVTEVKARTVAEATKLWERMIERGGEAPLGHDGYLKLWALGRPKLASDYILLDEAQDTNPVVLGVLADQDAQIVYVGDRHQQIYEWRGAVNAMERIGNCEEASLTQSFRFGPEIAAAASKVLATLGERNVIRGTTGIRGGVRGSGEAGTVLARTNAGVIQEVLAAGAAGKRAHVVGGVAELKRLLSDVYELKKGKPASCPEFFGFDSWREVVAFAETEEGQAIRTFVHLVEQHGESTLWGAVGGTVDEEDAADVVCSTAHKAKGREWDSVRLAPDFLSSQGEDAVAESEVRLFYVAMTRAKRDLVVAPELLGLFSSDAWKRRRTVTRSAQRGSAEARGGSFTPSGAKEQPRAETEKRAALRAGRASPARTDAAEGLREVVAPGAASKHPGAPGRDARATEGIREVVAPDAASKHPGAVGRHAQAAPPKSMWSRLARLFGL